MALLAQHEYDMDDLRRLERRLAEAERAWVEGRVVDPGLHAQFRRVLQSDIDELRARLACCPHDVPSGVALERPA